MIQRITGSWFEFQHFFDVEGRCWDPLCAQFTARQWERKIEEMAEIGIEYLVLMNVACHGKAYFETSLVPNYPIACENPIEVVLSAADRLGIKFFMGIGFLTQQGSPMETINQPEETRKRLQAMGEIAEKYGHHPSFYGWYWPDEACIVRYFQDEYIDYVKTNSKEGRRLKPDSKILIAPFGTRIAAADDGYVEQLDRLDVDIIAYQDEVGVEKTQVEELPAIYERLRSAHDKAAHAKLWADMEIFKFEGRVYHSALLPAPWARVQSQLEAISPFVDRILVYQYLGMMNKPDSEAFAGHPDSTVLYRDYCDWVKSSDDR